MKDQDTIRLEFELPKKYNKGLFGQPKCPKCGQRKAVFEVVCDPTVMTKMENGDTISTKLFDNKFHLQTDISNILDPKYYCQMDSLFF